MAGLLQQGMGPQGAPQTSTQAQPGQPPQDPQSQPAPDGVDPRVDMESERAMQQRDQLVEAMLGPLYDEHLEQARQILEQRSDNPPEGIGRILSQLMLTAWQALADQGKTVPPGVMIQAAMIAAQAIGDMAIRIGVLPEQGNGEAIEAGFMLGMAQFGQATRDIMPPEQRKRYQELLQGMKEAKGMSQAQASAQVGGATTEMQGGM